MPQSLSSQTSPLAHVQRGLTLVELLIAMAMLAMLIGVGVPGMQTLLSSMSVNNQTNRLVSSLAYTRSEAVARVENVSIRTLDQDGNGDRTADWSNGWEIFVDENGDCAQNGDDEVLRVVDSVPQGVTATSNSVSCLTFDKLGENATATETRFNVSKTGVETNGITVSSIGFTSKNSPVDTAP